jgi:hypothetical protein
MERELGDIEAVFVDGVDDMGDKWARFTTETADEFETKLPKAVQTAMDAVNEEIEKGFKEDRANIQKEMQAMMDDLFPIVEESKDKLNPFVVDEEKKKAWEEYKSQLVTTVRDANTGALAETKTFYGRFTDESLKMFKGIVPGLDEYDKKMSELAEQEMKVELDVPDDDKFKAQQAKLLKEIDSNAKIMESKMQGFADIVESENSTISASFESIGESINATGDTLSELYNQLGSKSLDIFAQQSIQKRIRDEESRREEAFALQKELTLAQIDLIKQRASAMASGDPLITVSGDGLQPHLEAFMWEILSAIQVRVNEDYRNFLLGIGA